MAQTRAFAIIGPAFWNQLPSLTRSCFLTGESSASFRSLNSVLFCLGLCEKFYTNVYIQYNTDLAMYPKPYAKATIWCIIIARSVFE